MGARQARPLHRLGQVGQPAGQHAPQELPAGAAEEVMGIFIPYWVPADMSIIDQIVSASTLVGEEPSSGQHIAGLPSQNSLVKGEAATPISLRARCTFTSPSASSHTLRRLAG